MGLGGTVKVRAGSLPKGEFSMADEFFMRLAGGPFDEKVFPREPNTTPVRNGRGIVLARLPSYEHLQSA